MLLVFVSADIACLAGWHAGRLEDTDNSRPILDDRLIVRHPCAFGEVFGESLRLDGLSLFPPSIISYALKNEFSLEEKHTSLFVPLQRSEILIVDAACCLLQSFAKFEQSRYSSDVFQSQAG